MKGLYLVSSTTPAGIVTARPIPPNRRHANGQTGHVALTLGVCQECRTPLVLDVRREWTGHGFIREPLCPERLGPKHGGRS